MLSAALLINVTSPRAYATLVATFKLTSSIHLRTSGANTAERRCIYGTSRGLWSTSINALSAGRNTSSVRTRCIFRHRSLSSTLDKLDTRNPDSQSVPVPVSDAVTSLPCWRANGYLRHMHILQRFAILCGCKAILTGIVSPAFLIVSVLIISFCAVVSNMYLL